MKVTFERPDLLGRNRRFLIIENIDSATNTYIFRQPSGTSWSQFIPEGSSWIPPDYLYWSIPEGALRPLMDALSAELDEAYAGDVKVLRQDYEHERKRVDKMIDHLLGSAQ